MKPGSRLAYKGEETGTQQSNLPRITKPACSGARGKQFVCFQPSSLCSDHQQTLVTSLPSAGPGALPGHAGSMPAYCPLNAPTLGPGIFFPHRNRHLPSTSSGLDSNLRVFIFPAPLSLSFHSTRRLLTYYIIYFPIVLLICMGRSYTHL